jgi:hypothetical protein
MSRRNQNRAKVGAKVNTKKATTATATTATATTATKTPGPVFVPSQGYRYAPDDRMIDRLVATLGCWWRTEDRHDVIELLPEDMMLSVLAASTSPLIPQFVAELRRVAAFCEDTAQCLDQHTDWIENGDRTVEKVG